MSHWWVLFPMGAIPPLPAEMAKRLQDPQTPPFAVWGNLLFARVPRCASHSLRAALPDCRLSPWEELRHHQGYDGFIVVVRHPLQRLVSGANMAMRLPAYQDANLLIRRLVRIRPERAHYVLRPQNTWLVTHPATIVRLERLPEDWDRLRELFPHRPWQPLPHLLRTKGRKHWRAALTPSTISLAREYYDEDFRRFGYTASA